MVEKLNRHSLVFMADLLNCMLDDVNVTILVADDPELMSMLDFVYNRLTLAYQRLSNYNVRKGYIYEK